MARQVVIIEKNGSKTTQRVIWVEEGRRASQVSAETFFSTSAGRGSNPKRLRQSARIR